MPCHTWIDRLGVRAPPRLILFKCLFDSLCESRILRIIARMWCIFYALHRRTLATCPYSAALNCTAPTHPSGTTPLRFPGNYTSSHNLYGRASAYIVYSLPKTFRLVPETNMLATLYVFPQLFSPPQGRTFVPPRRLIF
jgi:hypothetical protein